MRILGRLAMGVAAAAAIMAVTAPAAAAGGTAPQGLDCNGLGAGAPAGPVANYGCTELRRSDPSERVEINGHYVGHDEPLISYYSSTPGSGNNVQYRVRLPRDPSALPTGALSGPIWTFMLYPTFWFSMVLCDTQSFPEGNTSCTPDSDRNIQVPFQADHAGTAFLEMQFYPPGWSPFITQFSCDQTHWCASMHINSVQANLDFSVVNPNCTEPTAFAFIQRGGVPTGPAGPDDFTDASVTPNADTLLMNPGDDLLITMKDTPAGLLNQIDDLTTHQTGFMIGSARNGFRHIIWDPVNFTCRGEPYTYRPMYATSRPVINGEPRTWAGWSVHTVNVSASLEIGHFEAPDAANDPNGEEGPCFPGPTIPGCIGTDDDFDGVSYTPAYPDGSALHPTPALWSSPRSATPFGPYVNRYPRLNFETDLPAIEPTCNVFTGTGCSNPPPGAAFYPFPHVMRSSGPVGSCSWTIGANHPDQLRAFGGNPTVAWGPFETIDYGAGFIAPLNYATGAMVNPCP